MRGSSPDLRVMATLPTLSTLLTHSNPFLSDKFRSNIMDLFQHKFLSAFETIGCHDTSLVCISLCFLYLFSLVYSIICMLLYFSETSNILFFF